MMSTVALWEVCDRQTLLTITETYLQRGGLGGGVGMIGKYFSSVYFGLLTRTQALAFSLSSHTDYAVKSPKITLDKKDFTAQWRI